MYTLKLSYGDVDEFGDEPEPEVVEILDTYEDKEEAIKAAASKFDEVLKNIDYSYPCEAWYGEVVRSPYRYYVNYGAVDEYNTRISDEYYEVSVEEDY